MNHFYDNVLLLRVYHRCNLVICTIQHTHTHLFLLGICSKLRCVFLVALPLPQHWRKHIKATHNILPYIIPFLVFSCKPLMMMIFCVLSVISSFRSYTLFEKAEPFIRKLSYVPDYTSYIVVEFTICPSNIRCLSINSLIYSICY